MGKVSSLFARKVVEAVDDAVDKTALLQSVGLDWREPLDPSRMIEDTAYYGFLERAAQADPDPMTLPLRAGASMRCDEYGAFGLAWKSAPTLRGSYDRAERYGRVLSSVSTYELEPTGGGAFMHLHREGERRLGLRLSNEATIASIASISRQVSAEPFRPLAVCFKHSAPASVAGHESYFGCPVYFETDRDALQVSEDTLRTPNILGDPGLSGFFDQHLASEIETFSSEATLDRRVREYVSKALSEGAPPLVDVARHLGMSERTLQRRLTEQSTSYQTLLDEVRQQLARRLLQETEFSLVEVAFMTGYSDQTAFTRAFKRWTGQTPRSFRIAFQTP